MSSVINIIDLGSTEITFDHQSVILPNELILQVADEIRSRLKQDDALKPVKPTKQDNG